MPRFWILLAEWIAWNKISDGRGYTRSNNSIIQPAAEILPLGPWNIPTLISHGYWLWVKLPTLVCNTPHLLINEYVFMGKSPTEKRTDKRASIDVSHIVLHLIRRHTSQAYPEGWRYNVSQGWQVITFCVNGKRILSSLSFYLIVTWTWENFTNLTM